MTRFEPFLLQQPRVLEHGRGFDGQGLDEFPVASRQVGRGRPRIQVQQAGGFAGRGEHVGGIAHPGADADQRNADHAAQFQIHDGALRRVSSPPSGSKFM